ncbi:MAG: hypothetical protein ABJB33_06665, partial [Gemmatimonadota bacterium]
HWLELLSHRFAEVLVYRHYWRDGIQPDFTDPFPSRLGVNDFRFEALAPSEFFAQPTLTALFVARV